jgi:predicted O-linked N-acetylglucosamine transferase (SPINDLY family)
MRARLTAGLYAHMGVSRWLASSVDDFVRLALELAQAKENREALGEEIREGADRFMENETVVREYEEFIEAAVARTQDR